MIEFFYDTDTRLVTAWRSGNRIGCRPTRENETKIMLDIELSSLSAREYLFDEITKTLIEKPQDEKNLVSRRFTRT